ncbi:hypothetical protein [Rhodospirillum sp. A1_3_36]|uniref:hypothetical protein n=1 Tax=Rhodospirillum sp. A1_3_36 TaxID=3391666 RepID=UPI0039A4143B
MIPGLHSARLAVNAVSRPLVLRRTTGGYVDGRWVQDMTEAPIRGSILQMSEADRLNLPEGIRVEAEATLYTTAAIVAADESAGNPGDRIVDGAKLWQVLKLAERVEGGFNKAFLGAVADTGQEIAR